MKIGLLDFRDFRIEDVEAPAEEFAPFVEAIKQIDSAIRASSTHFPPPQPLAKRTEEFFPPEKRSP